MFKYKKLFIRNVNGTHFRTLNLGGGYPSFTFMIAASTRYSYFLAENSAGFKVKSSCRSNIRALMTFVPAVDTGTKGRVKEQKEQNFDVFNKNATDSSI
ncbi:MAG: hypothetical protein EPN85_05550 [Bacteroidetes bacterium]|nr:MAG: hypothetical protein EPN85_05550 [Bacteroidota bacterium]